MSIATWTTRFLPRNAQEVGAQASRHGSQTTIPLRRGVPAAASASIPENRVGSCVITRRLGCGGVGEVFKGVDVMLNREVAIKRLRDELAADPVFLERFSNEARLHAKLSHPNVASVHAFVQQGDKQFLVMEYVAGVTLDEFVRAGGPVPVARALAIFRRVLDGVDHVHAHGIVHRDIKPENIMLADDGQVKVMDFGIAHALDSREHLTRTGHVAGTAKAMAPEQIRGEPADVRSDVYALGIVLYTLLAGHAPFEVGSDVEVMAAQLDTVPPSLRGQIKDLPRSVESVVMHALQKDPDARFQSVRSLAVAIDKCIAELATMSQPPSPGSRGTLASDRTAINPAILGARRRPPEAVGDGAGASWRSATRIAKWARSGTTLTAAVALASSTALVWSNHRTVEPVAATGLSTPAGSAPAQPATATSAPSHAAAHTTADESGPARTVEGPAPITLEILDVGSDSVHKLPEAQIVAQARTAHPYQAGQRLRLMVKASQDAHVYCYLQDEDSAIVRFYPNRFQRSALVKASEPLEIPGRMAFELVANRRSATETVACFAADRDMADALPQAAMGTDFTALPVATLDEVRRAFEQHSGQAVASAQFRIEVR